MSRCGKGCPCGRCRFAPWSGPLRWYAGGSAGSRCLRARPTVGTSRINRASLARRATQVAAGEGFPNAVCVPPPVSNAGRAPVCCAPAGRVPVRAARLRPRGMAAGTASPRPAASLTGAAPSQARPTQITGPDDASRAAHPLRQTARYSRLAEPSFDGRGKRTAVAGHAYAPVRSVVGPAAPPCKPFLPPLPRLDGARAGGASEFRTE